MTSNNNGHDPMDDFDQENSSGEVIATASENGHQPEQPLTPSQRQILMTEVQRGQAGGIPDYGLPLISTSLSPAEFLARTIVTNDEIGWFKRIIFRNHIANRGYVREAEAIWAFFAIRPSLDGIARQQYINTVTGRQQVEMMQRANFLERLTRSSEDRTNGSNHPG